jgi:Polyketide cyclase / dehydrase and lipid transport
MHLQLIGQVTINAPARNVWHILAREYSSIGRWASAIPQSEAVTDLPPPAGAAVCGRVCSTAMSGFSAVREQFTYYDEHAMRFGYQATDGRPAFITHAENNWQIRALTPETCVVEARGELDIWLFPGLFLAPLLKLQMDRAAAQLFEELKYYVEHDQPHPRKLKEQRKQVRQAARF